MADIKKDISKAEQEHKLKFMKAADLFAPEELTQIFSAKTGKYLGTVKEGEEVTFNEQGEPELPQPEANPNQLNLF